MLYMSSRPTYVHARTLSIQAEFRSNISSKPRTNSYARYAITSLSLADACHSGISDIIYIYILPYVNSHMHMYAW